MMMSYDIFMMKPAPNFEEYEDCARLKDAFRRLIDLRHKNGFLTAKNLDDLLDLESENPYTLYCGNTDKYRYWVIKEIGQLRKEMNSIPVKYQKAKYDELRKQYDLAAEALVELAEEDDEDDEE